MDESPSSPGQAAASAASTRCSSPPRAHASSSTTHGGANDGSASGRRPPTTSSPRSATPAARRWPTTTTSPTGRGRAPRPTAIDAYGDLDIVVNNAGILRDRTIVNMTEAEWDDVITVHLKGHFAPTRRAAVYWRSEHKAGRDKRRQPGAHVEHVGAVREPGSGQLRRREVGDRDLQPDRAKELSRYDVMSNCIAPGARTRLTLATPGLDDIMAPADRLRRVGSGQHLAARRLPGTGRVRVHRRDVPRAGRCRQAGRRLVDPRHARAAREVDRRRARRSFAAPN